ncbi:MAG: hypothetical protein QM636_10455 [Rhizobium sp.]
MILDIPGRTAVPAKHFLVFHQDIGKPPGADHELVVVGGRIENESLAGGWRMIPSRRPTVMR